MGWLLLNVIIPCVIGLAVGAVVGIIVGMILVLNGYKLIKTDQ